MPNTPHCGILNIIYWEYLILGVVGVLNIRGRDYDMVAIVVNLVQVGLAILNPYISLS